ncbi:hypothetical protein O6H91_07G126700 [Diphasiastrum complanatum]|uniref:Uncharacterized protein n=6 Tax=Diphasiastrum complanatum TaxID=34168 RepID=A0ACC2D9T1_DIPCM|nr:hypothetical protein O6H91_07G126700 [Diphasiastrum complanatum]KAJ7550958.1 hypothetical protein O6H91_07G126700 [Diphasiastrum complanatum]KAJ7550959.1 hypothetical protein O6H91_07G126700 [Diphasiastrum complanatum]KAJ7550960.1 hypothetical protein O6H91_07G126700 [Diphasiastrum complanatum]KAJ7550961.1 hypothetical protein O6H91_07G126700 [Diphasiastrum complanatum]
MASNNKKLQAPQQMSRVPSTGSLGSMGSQVQSQPPMSTSTFQQQPHQPWLSGQSKPMQTSSAAYQSQLQQQALQKQQQQQQMQQQQWQLSQTQQPKQPQQQLSMQQLPQMQQRVQLVGNQRPPTPIGTQQNTATGPLNSVPSGVPTSQLSSFNKSILGKRSIQELVGQVDPHERLDPEGEDIPVETADDFNETVRQKQAHYQPIGPSGNPMQGLQSMGMMGSGGLSSQLGRPSAPVASPQQRMQQASLRPQQQQQSMTSPQKMQAPQQMSRVPSTGSLGSMGSQMQSMSPSSQPFVNPSLFQQQSHQQWVSGQSKPTQPSSAAYQSQLQQQAQQKQQQQQAQQQRPQPQPQPQPHQQLKQQQQQPPMQQLPQPQHRVQLVGNQRPPTPTGAQQNITTGPPNSVPTGGPTNQPSSSNNRILGKRSIQELVAQVDPHQRLDPEVEDILVDIADNFIDSVTASACALAKHRKSSTLEVKDVLLHLDRNWHITIPGFGGDEYRSYKKPSISEAHKQRIQLVKKSLAAAPPGSDGGVTKAITGPTTSGLKSLQHPSSSAVTLASPLSSPGPSRTSR